MDSIKNIDIYQFTDINFFAYFTDKWMQYIDIGSRINTQILQIFKYVNFFVNSSIQNTYMHCFNNYLKDSNINKHHFSLLIANLIKDYQSTNNYFINDNIQSQNKSSLYNKYNDYIIDACDLIYYLLSLKNIDNINNIHRLHIFMIIDDIIFFIRKFIKSGSTIRIVNIILPNHLKIIEQHLFAMTDYDIIIYDAPELPHNVIADIAVKNNSHIFSNYFEITNVNTHIITQYDVYSRCINKQSHYTQIIDIDKLKNIVQINIFITKNSSNQIITKCDLNNIS